MSRRIPTAAELGLMVGDPPPLDRLVTLDNWQSAPFNRWAFQHVRELIPTARIRRGDGPMWRLPRGDRDLTGIRVRTAGRRVSLGRWLEDTYTDGIVVLHRGRIVLERYFNDLSPDRTHLCQSVSKSIASTVAGSLVAKGLLRPTDLVTAHLPELAGSSFEGATVRHLLDMRAGTRFNEDYDDPLADVRIYEAVCGWRSRDATLPLSLTAYYPTLENQGPHGGPFGYRSILTDVLGWVIERAGGARYADLVSSELWQPMGAEFDAEVTVDPYGHPLADGGVCCTVRDLAKLGQLMLKRGRRGRQPVVAEAWIRDTLVPDDDAAAAFVASEDDRYPRGAFYRNQWWIIDPRGPIFTASGIYGQSCFIHVPAQVVIAKFSTWPVAWNGDFSRRTWTGEQSLAEEIGG